MISQLITVLTLLVTTVVQANDGIDVSLFTENNGLAAAQAAAPLWYMTTGSCLPSAAEDGQGHQTNGVDVPIVLCGINQNQASGCPPQPQWQGANTGYYNIPGEPFSTVPTYYQIGYCSADQSWRIYYGVYFKKDVSHKSDWEWAIVKFTTEGNNKWTRYGLLMEADGTYGVGYWGNIPNTFNSADDWQADGQKNLNYPKLFFSKRHHSVHYDPESRNKNTCIAPDFRANDFQFWSYWNLRHVNVIDPNWTYGQATNPRHLDICDNRGQNF